MSPSVHALAKGKTTFGAIQCMKFAEGAESETDEPLYRVISPSTREAEKP